MSISKDKILKYFIIAVIAVLIAWVWSQRNNQIKQDYKRIKHGGVLNAVTEYNSVSYFIENDTISGFHYELINAFANAKNLEIEITPEMSFEKRLQGLRKREYDVIAYGIPITSEMRDSVLFTIPIIRSKQILVQRKEELDSASYISNHLQLAKKTIHIVKNSPSLYRIKNLSNEIADEIYTKEVEKYGPEQLLAMVAYGDIDYAVTDENIALAAIDSFPQLDISTDISFTQFYAWAVRKESTALCDTLNNWLTGYMKTKEFKQTYSKYF